MYALCRNLSASELLIVQHIDSDLLRYVLSYQLCVYYFSNSAGSGRTQ